MSGGCPVDHSKPTSSPANNGCPVDHAPTSDVGKAAVCPVDQGAKAGWREHQAKSILNVPLKSDAVCSSERSEIHIVGDDFPDSRPQFADQKNPLSTIPIKSPIPKSSDKPDDDRWVFPSPQRFYNALKKKGWEADEALIPYVVSVHNTVNVQAWQRVMQYERLHLDKCPNPMLKKFQGRPMDFSPKARWNMLLGRVKPFDRHDWVVDRCGEEVKYIIDFYAGASNPEDETAPSVFLDVRPAITFSSLMDRARVNLGFYPRSFKEKPPASS